MRKTLRYSLTMLLAIIGLNTYAGSIDFGTLGLENAVQYGDPFDGGDFYVTFSGGGNDGKYYNTGSAIRLYGGGTMTITSKSGNLTKIVITYDGTYKPESADVVSGGTYDPVSGTWTGNEPEVAFTRPSGTGHWRIKSITTGSDAVGPEVPTEGQTAETAITVSRALELINTLSDNATTDFAYYVKGYVTAIDRIQASNVQFFMGDAANSANTVKTYNLKGLGNKNVTNLEFVKAGDEVVVYGSLQKFVKDSEVTPEVSGGYVYSVNGKTEEEPAPVLEPQEVTLAEALNVINGLADNATTSGEYILTGYVNGTPDFQRKNDGSLYGNVNFTFVETQGMGVPTLEVYRAKYFDNKNFTEETIAKLYDGAAVTIQGKLEKYVKDGNTTPELVNGYLLSINGETSVNTITATSLNADAPMYNLAGQRVNKEFKGVIIQNGRKFINK